MNALEAHTSTSAPSIERVGSPRIRVIGLGGAGTNAVNRMIELGLPGVDFVAANTDKQALSSSLAPVRLQLGPRITRGLGAGGDPEIGAAAAMESSGEIAAALTDADMVFVTAGMGGGTGTGAAPIAAEIAKELGAVVIAVVTMPFGFEMKQRARNALLGVKGLTPHAHTMITVPNDRLLQVVSKTLSLEIAFRLADDVLRQGVQGVTELVTRPGLINVDFAHVRRLLLGGGGSLMAIGLGKGENKATDAIQEALHHPLLEIESFDQATGALVHFTGGDDLTLHEVGEAVNSLRESLLSDVDVIMGATNDSALASRAQVILIVTGLGARPVSPLVEEVALETDAAVEPVGQALPQDLDLPAFLRHRMELK